MMHIVENQKIRVGVPMNQWERLVDRHGEQVARGRILSDAMRALQHRAIVESPPEPDFEAARKDVEEDLVWEYLNRPEQRYDPHKLHRRATQGLAMSQGMAIEWAAAQAYAAGRIGVSRDELLWLADEWFPARVLGTAEEHRRMRRLELMTEDNCDPEVMERIHATAIAEVDRTLEYSRRLVRSELEITVLRSDLIGANA